MKIEHIVLYVNDGDGYYESCIVAIEGNQIEVTE